MLADITIKGLENILEVIFWEEEEECQFNSLSGYEVQFGVLI